MIVEAVPEDKVPVIRLLEQSHHSAGFDNDEGGFCFPFDPAYAERLFLEHLMPGRLCLVLKSDDVARGVLMATAAEHPFGQVRIARETVWFINPSHRGISSVKMLDAYEAWARDHGCQFVGMAGMGAHPDVAKLYERRGYRPAERHFLKAI